MLGSVKRFSPRFLLNCHTALNTQKPPLAEHLNKKNGTALNLGGKVAAPLVYEKSSFICSAINVPKAKVVLEADGSRDVESLPLALRRYDVYMKYALTDHYCLTKVLVRLHLLQFRGWLD